MQAILAHHSPPRPVIGAEKIAELDAILADAEAHAERFAWMV